MHGSYRRAYKSLLGSRYRIAPGFDAIDCECAVIAANGRMLAVIVDIVQYYVSVR